MAEMRSSVVITVFSTVSGVGKTIVAINMAAELARLGHSVCLMDLDLQFGDVCNYLRLVPAMTISDAQFSLNRSPETFQADSFLTVYKRGNVSFSILAPPRTLNEVYGIQANIIERMVADLNRFDFIIFDTSKVFNELNLVVLDLSTIITFLCIADFVPAIKNLKVGYDTLYRFNYDENKIRLIQNRSDSQKLILTEDVEGVLGRQFYHNLPNDFLSAKNSIETGCPLVLSGLSNELSESLKVLVAKYTNRYTEPEEQEEETGFFASLKKLFD